MSRRVVVDWTRCDGHGLCARMWPDGISLDDWGFPIVAPGPVPAEALPDARRAVSVCPRLALRVTTGP